LSFWPKAWFNCFVRKAEALQYFPTVRQAAAEIGCTAQAVSAWPDPLPARIRDRVQAALWRRHIGQPLDTSATQPQELANAE